MLIKLNDNLITPLAQNIFSAYQMILRFYYPYNTQNQQFPKGRCINRLETLHFPPPK